jgi:hypothetical protein
MNTALLALLALALVASVLALGREMRIRKALEKLLYVLLFRWRVNASKTEPKKMDSVDRIVRPDKRL